MARNFILYVMILFNVGGVFHASSKYTKLFYSECTSRVTCIFDHLYGVLKFTSQRQEIVHRDVFGCLLKTPRFCILNFPLKSVVCFRSYIKHSSQCFITISKTSKSVKNTPLAYVMKKLCLEFDKYYMSVLNIASGIREFSKKISPVH